MKEVNKMKNKNRKFGIGYILIAALLIAVGICLMVFSDALKMLAIAVGATVSIFSVIFAVLTLANKDRGFAFGFKIALAVCCLAAGITSIICQEVLIKAIISVFSLIIIIDSSYKLNTTVMCKRYLVSLWWLPLIFSVVGIAGGFAFIKFVTADNLKLISILLGILAIFDAVSNILAPIFIPRYERQQKADMYYDFHRKELEEKGLNAKEDCSEEEF